ncbi:hypothetical protein [Lysinibacillus xylanilyticus]|uniref:hypothetical protein n=1 Tax=Lysinibacillus xylanilyticus TaxID=582475 RepID=UPI003D01DE24
MTNFGAVAVASLHYAFAQKTSVALSGSSDAPGTLHCAKAKRQQQYFNCAKAKRQQQSAQSERKSTPRYGDKPQKKARNTYLISGVYGLD